MLKLGFRLSIGIQNHVFFIPWVKRHSAPPRILCLERDYNCSGLSKYVPKKSRKGGGDLTSQPVTSSEKVKYASKLDHGILGSEGKVNSNEDGEDTFLDLQEKNDDRSYMSESFDECYEGIMSLENGMNASRLDRGMLGAEGKGNNKELTQSKFLGLQEKTDAGYDMSESFDDSDDDIMSLEKGINPNRWDHSAYRSKVKSSFKEAGQGTSLHLKDKGDAGMYSNVSCDDFREELEESSNPVTLGGYKPMRKHKIVYDLVKLHIEAEQAKSSGKACKTTQEAENMAIRYLGLRAYSAEQLKKKLIGKKYPLEIVDRVINDFQRRSFINDSLYAESFARSRWSSLSWGPRRIKQALFEKGISNQDSEAAINLVFEKNQCKEGDEEPELKHGLSKEAVDQLYVQASKRWVQGRDLPIETRKARVIRWLQYRGHNWGVVSQLLKRLESHQSWISHGDEESKAEPELKQGLSKEEVDQLYVQASKRWVQGRDLPIETRKARVTRWLQYRGHNWGIVSQLLKRLESHQS